MNPKVWEASGHVSGFSDPLVECKNCHTRTRVDKMLNEIGVSADEKIDIKQINELVKKYIDKISCPDCGSKDFTEAKKFNLLVRSNLGNFTSDWMDNPAYLRGETCQGIYVDYKPIMDSMRVKIPFGVAQIGKAFRNEITARKFIFRTREFEQMEMQYFVSPDSEMEEYEKLRENRWSFFKSIGLSEQKLKWHRHENLVFYAKEAYDVEYEFPWGFDELEGVHARGDYDLTQHSKFSGVDLSYTDIDGKKYIPHIIESSVGVGRLLFAILSDSLVEEKLENGTRTVLKLNKGLAPIKVAVFPLLKNKPELVEKAMNVNSMLKHHYMTEFDDNGNVGKRYRRQDEIGTPYCVTIDFDTLADDTVTIRDRDTMKQDRVNIAKLNDYLANGLTAF
jgi:glycyl-tRNA synthetase